MSEISTHIETLFKDTVPSVNTKLAGDFINAIVTNKTMEFFETNGVDLSKGVDFNKIVQVAKMVCSILGPICQLVNGL